MFCQAHSACKWFFLFAFCSLTAFAFSMYGASSSKASSSSPDPSDALLKHLAKVVKEMVEFKPCVIGHICLPPGSKKQWDVVAEELRGYLKDATKGLSPRSRTLVTDAMANLELWSSELFAQSSTLEEDKKLLRIKPVQRRLESLSKKLQAFTTEQVLAPSKNEEVVALVKAFLEGLGKIYDRVMQNMAELESLRRGAVSVVAARRSEHKKAEKKVSEVKEKPAPTAKKDVAEQSAVGK